MEKKGSDSVLDVKVLPDRAHYALSHQGIAYEIGAIIGEKIHHGPGATPHGEVSPQGLKIQIANQELCPRYIGRVIENIEIKETPTWMKERLGAVGQRTINPIVDITNYVMLDTGQPLHAFDAEKLKGDITVRLAKNGEKLELLGNKIPGKIYSNVLKNIRIDNKIGDAVLLDESVLVIADDVGPLAIAGIKGGRHAEVTEKTTRIVLESANFSARYVRKISVQIGVKSDSSKRFENGISSYWTEVGMNEAIALITELCPGAKASDSFDSAPQALPIHKLSVPTRDISLILGISISEKDITEILSRLDFAPMVKNGTLTVRAPVWRQDIKNVFDIAEEVGRLYGYDKINAKLRRPDADRGTTVKILLNKNFYWQEKIRDFLMSEGFSEVCTYSFRKEGDREVLKSLASDKNFLRSNLTKNIEEVLAFNLNNAPLLDVAQVKIFEIGKVFPKNSEETSLCVGIAQPKSFKGTGVNEQIREVRDGLVKFLGSLRPSLSEASATVATVCTIDDSGGIILLSGRPIGMINNVDGVMELNLGKLTDVLPDPEEWDIPSPKNFGEYKPISPYPFIVRDVAVYVDPEDSFSEILKIISRLENEGKLPNLYKKPQKPFDEFVNAKLKKKSFAFRLVFQSNDRTLTDTEVNVAMEDLYSALKEHSAWHIR